MKTVVVAHPSGKSAWCCSFPETPSENQTTQQDQFIFDLGNQIESLRQQLETSQKREVMLRDALSYYDGSHSIDQWDENLMPSRAWDKRRIEALAATADLDGLILCEKKPVGYRYELKAGEYTFSENRYSDERYVSRMTPLYRAWEPK